MREIHKVLDKDAARISTAPRLSLYVSRVLALYMSLPAVRRRVPAAADYALASELEKRGIPLVSIEVALLEGQLQRTRRDYEQGRLDRLRLIGSLAYFLPIVKKTRRMIYPEGTVEALARQLRLMEDGWQDPGIELPAEARRR